MFISKNIKKTAIISLVVGFVAVPLAAYAQEDNTIVTANISSTISMTTSEDVAINVMPAVGGSQSSNSDTISVSTNGSSGYTLTLENADTDTELEGGIDDIAAHTGTLAAPTALSDNTWGYAVAGEGGFDGSYTQFTDDTSSATLWAGVPALGSGDTIKITNDPAPNDTTTVWYSVKVDTSKPDGEYTDTVLYTATAN